MTRSLESSAKVRVAFYPHLSIYQGNPYWKLLAEALAPLGVELVDQPDPLNLQWRWLVEQRGQVQALHFHFLKPHYDGADGWASLPRLARFMGKTVLARMLGYRLVWTVHNLKPHERLRPDWVDNVAARWMAWLAHVLIVHCDKAARLVRESLRPWGQIRVLSHPSYTKAYPQNVTKAEARSRLGWCDDERVLLYFGAIRPYKGLQRLLRAFRGIPGDTAHMVLAGKVWDEEYGASLHKQASQDSRVSIKYGFVSEEDVPYFITAADLVVLPYTNVLTSGAALLALTFGRPVVAPRLGCLPEALGKAGILYDPQEDDALEGALKRALEVDFESLSRVARRQAKRWSWDQMARSTAAIYQRTSESHAAP